MNKHEMEQAIMDLQERVAVLEAEKNIVQVFEAFKDWFLFHYECRDIMGGSGHVWEHTDPGKHGHGR